MARANLTAMLERLDPGASVATVRPTSKAGNATAPPADAPSNGSTPTESAPGRVPVSGGYLSFERKETRLRADQYARLTQEARRLNKAKGTGGERITENTLIRIAIDLLFERVEDLSGSTETELRNSVTS
jgi:hypothetical protein